MKKRIAVLSIGLIAVIGAAGCAETKDEAEPAEANVQTEAVESDPNQDIADLYAKTAPRDLAQVCGGMTTVGRPATEKMATNILGPQIVKMGGDIEAVVDNLLDRC